MNVGGGTKERTGNEEDMAVSAFACKSELAQKRSKCEGMSGMWKNECHCRSKRNGHCVTWEDEMTTVFGFRTSVKDIAPET